MAVLVGPSHFVGFDGVAVVPSGGFETPFGVASIDAACAADLTAATAIVREHPSAHAREHSLEMQLPFLQRVAPDAAIVPLVMGYQTADTAQALAEALAVGRRAAGARCSWPAPTCRTITIAPPPRGWTRRSSTASRASIPMRCRTR